MGTERNESKTPSFYMSLLFEVLGLTRDNVL